MWNKTGVVQKGDCCRPEVHSQIGRSLGSIVALWEKTTFYLLSHGWCVDGQRSFKEFRTETKIDEQGTEFRSGVALLIHLVFVSSKEKNLTRREKSVFEINSITCKVERKLFLHCLTNLGPAVVDQVQPQNNYGVL